MATHIDSADYQRLYKVTRRIGPEVHKAFRKRLREAAKIGQQAARLKIRQMPATHRYSAAGAGRHFRKRPVGLRSTLALNIRIRVTGNDVRIEQHTAGLVGNSVRDLPRDIDRGGWRHPTFGHRPNVFQRGTPYFKREIDAHSDEMTAEVRQLLDDITDVLDRLG